MVRLAEHQRDALTELVNIAFGRAAASLSALTGQRVLVQVPELSVCRIDELYTLFDALIPDEVATVHQVFSGSVAGSALIMLDYKGALCLARLLREDQVAIEQLSESDHETLTEVGNILLSACLGTFGNVLKVHISFSVPRLNIESVPALLDSLRIGREELIYAIVVVTRFELRDGSVGGHLVIVLGVSSLMRLMAAIDVLG